MRAPAVLLGLVVGLGLASTAAAQAVQAYDWHVTVRPPTGL